MDRPNVNDSAADWEDYVDELLETTGFGDFVENEELELGTKAKNTAAVQAWEDAQEEGAQEEGAQEAAGEAQQEEGGEATGDTPAAQGGPFSSLLPVLSRGTQDAHAVKVLHALLEANGYSHEHSRSPRGELSGHFSVWTESTVADFQEDQLSSNDYREGFVADATWEDLIDGDDALTTTLLAVNGYTGDNVERELKRFQRRRGLEMTGEADDATVELLLRG